MESVRRALPGQATARKKTDKRQRRALDQAAEDLALAMEVLADPGRAGGPQGWDADILISPSSYSRARVR